MTAGRKSKYDANTFPLLAEGYARDGLSDKQIAAKLGISVDSIYQYQKQFPEFSEAIKRGKAPVDFMVENALLKRALGFKYDEVHNVTKQDGENKGNEVRVTTKEIVPDTTAAIIWLKNRRPDRWRDKQEIALSGDMKISFGDDEHDL